MTMWIDCIFKELFVWICISKVTIFAAFGAFHILNNILNLISTQYYI